MSKFFQDTDELETYPATPEEIFYSSLGEDLLRQSVPTLNDYLQKLVLLETAVIGGGLLSFRDEAMPPAWRIAALIVLVLGIASAMIGLFPRTGPLVANCAEMVKDTVLDAVERKRWWMRASCWCLIAALTCLVAGVIAKVI